MNFKRFFGSIIAIFGIILIVIAVHAEHKVAVAKSLNQDITNFFEHNPELWNPIIKFFGGKAQEKVAAYDTPIMITLISGIILAIIGIVMGVVCRNKK